jgi:hypothetical protein
MFVRFKNEKIGEQKEKPNNRASTKTRLFWQKADTKAIPATDRSFSNTHIWQKTVSALKQKSLPPEAFS